MFAKMTLFVVLIPELSKHFQTEVQFGGSKFFGGSNFES